MAALRKALRDLPETVFADVLESDDDYLLVVDLPGATPETVDASIEGSRLHIEARREKDVPSEFRYVEEHRSLFLDVDLPLPPDAARTGASGSVDRGVLELTIRKTTSTPRQTIDVGRPAGGDDEV